MSLGSRFIRTCQICHKSLRAAEAIPAELVRDTVAELMQRDVLGWSPTGYVCLPDLNRYRARYVEEILRQERGELGEMEEEVLRGLREMEVVTADVNAEFDRELSFGERLADRVASFGGSWTFILVFGGLLAVWVAVNTVVLATRSFDPYPFILLNLVLSCLAALQAPVIMMSQNRQEAKDRLRAEHDYRVNLKAEIEIRLLSDRIDRLLTHQWSRLLEIQQIQVELMEQLGHGGRRRGREPAP